MKIMIYKSSRGIRSYQQL